MYGGYFFIPRVHHSGYNNREKKTEKVADIVFFGNPTPHAAAKGYTQVLTGRLTAARNYDVVGDLLVIRIFFIRFLSSTRVRPPIFPPRHGKSPHTP